ncbi:MAG: DUF4910 domain-containing protein [Candidatus Aminicenantia bacterium]
MNYLKRGIFIIIGFLLIISSGLAEKPLASEKLKQALIEEISGEIAFKYTALISHFDRIQASEGFHKAAVMIKKELEKIGYKDVVIESWPSNGSTYYYTYRTPIGWRAKSAELWMISPEKIKLCSYREMPLTLVKHSNSCSVEAELIDVGTGVGKESYQNKDVKGKIVLATAYTGTVMREAVLKRGALGVITWYPPEIRPGYSNMVRYTAIWPEWENKDKIGFGFNISKIQGWNLKRLLDQGKKVILRAEVEAEYYQSKVEILTTSFPGTEFPDQEVLIIGHLCHPTPSTNDNASGSGGMVEMARALKNMVDKKLINPSKRTIRFLWVPEFAGTMPYIKAHLDQIKNTIATINCDMIGEDLHKTGGILNITCTPDSIPSFLNDVVINFAKLAEDLDLKSINGSNHPFVFKIRPASGGSDHYIFNDGAIKVPAIMLGHNDIFHHTNLDTPDKVDSSELRRVCFIALGSVIYLANASESDALAMAQLITKNGLNRLANDYYDSLTQIFESKNDAEKLYQAYKQVLNVIEHSLNREEQAVRSTFLFVRNLKQKKEIESLTRHLSILGRSFREETEKIYKDFCKKLKIKPKKAIITEEERKFSKIIPVRSENFKGPIFSDYLKYKVGEEMLQKIKIRGMPAYEAVNFIDGKRSVSDIARAITAEFGPINISDLYDYYQILEKAELIKLMPKAN